MNYSDQISALEVLDETVVNEANEKIGDINDVLIDSNGKVAAVIVGVGGFLGMGPEILNAQPYFSMTAISTAISNT